MNLNQTIYWIGGSACSGKSTIAAKYAEKYGLDLYACDFHSEVHLKLISPQHHPAMHKSAVMDFNEAFCHTDPQEKLRHYIQFFMEDFLFVIEDLAAKRADRPIIVEGNQLLPCLVDPYLRSHSHHRALWIVPSESFQREHYSQRPWIHDVLRQTDNPVMAFDNWMDRDASFARYVYREAAELHRHVIEVDGSVSLQENFEIVEKILTDW
ncbi:hypothetical protein [Paenibacillus sp. GCM10012306]|uniref:hypothetical protein n=1 Tax=Paenibacillus sp. GCM10012306 TaxID=3317342 RepID=UPI00360CEA99